MDDQRVAEALRRGDEDVFRFIVMRHHAGLVRTARSYVSSHAIAEEVAQDTWVAVIKGIDRFEGRSSFKTWLYRILVNRARTRGEREGRTRPTDAASDEPSVATSRFHDRDHPHYGAWRARPADWALVPDDVVESTATRQIIDVAIDALPPLQRDVITLRDLDGLSSAEVCDSLGLTEANQRVLLHRARSRVRAILEQHFAEVSSS